jgi:saccharopine dehydrogenase-like NADP-dependent oxidoreductase
MATDNSVIVFGASGNVGQYLVPALVSAGVKVTVVSREGSTSTLSYENVFVAKADYNSQDSLISIIRGHGAVISLLSAGVLGLQKNLIDAAIATGVTYFIPSEYGHDTTNEEIVPLLPAFSAKREIVAYLKEKEKDGLSWTSPITALFFDWVNESSFNRRCTRAKSAAGFAERYLRIRLQSWQSYDLGWW